MSQFEIDKMVANAIADTLHTRLLHKHKTATPQAVVMGVALLLGRMDKATGSGEGRAYQDFAIALLGGAEKIKEMVLENEGVTAPAPSSAPNPDSHSGLGVGDSSESSLRPS